MVGMMWFKREPKTVSEKTVENGVVSKLRKKKGSLLKPTRESSERETSTESDKERRRYSDILDMKVSLGMYCYYLPETKYGFLARPSKFRLDVYVYDTIRFVILVTANASKA